MADKNEKETSDENVTKSKKIAISPKKNVSMRESSAKTRAKAEKPRGVRKAAVAAKRPVKSVKSALSKEFHLLGSTNEEKRNTKFLTKSRKLTPGYFRSAWAEMKFVTWPGRKETWRLVFAVFAFAIVLGTLIAVLDYGLERLLREVIL